MSYQALYRKWRPDSFEEVKGQEAIVQTLRNQVKYGRVGHAYLFCGTRGTGKTTLAKLMAKSVNCEHVKDGSPCGECESCKAIAAGNSMNVVEIDAASNNGVDNIRQINNAVTYMPTSGKYLVYIIDEVHMLSSGAFNALLKTLEEPPEYVIFILATTESYKIPVTIMSRCQRYDFRRIALETITDRLTELLGREGVEASREAVSYVARAADGSMRDALSILDRCISYNLGARLELENVLSAIGAVGNDLYIRLLKAVSAYRVKDAIETVSECIWQGKELSQLASEFTVFIRNVLMLKLAPGMDTDFPKEQADLIMREFGELAEGRLLAYINVLNDALAKMNGVTEKKILFEVAVIKLCTPEMRTDETALLERIELLEKKLAEGVQVQVMQAGSAAGFGYESRHENPVAVNDDDSDGITGEEVLENLKEKYSPADLDDIMKLTESFNQIKGLLSPLCRSYVHQAIPVPGENSNELALVMENNSANKMAIGFLSHTDEKGNKNNLDAIADVITKHIGKEVKVALRTTGVTGEEIKKAEKFDLSKIKFDNIKRVDD